MKRHLELVKASDLFAHYRNNLKAPQQSVITEVVAVIYEVTGFEISPKQCSYTVATRTVSLQVPSLLKQELKTHHEAIMARLREELGERSVPLIVL